MSSQLQRGQVILADTNIIIEAVRTRCWAAICGHFSLETVETCCEEVLRGDRRRPGYVTVSPEQIGMARRHKVTPLERIQLRLKLDQGLDPGEQDLFAHALSRSDAWILGCADKAPVKVALKFGWEERLISLEKVAQAVGMKPLLKRHFTESWLSEIRTQHKLGL